MIKKILTITLTISLVFLNDYNLKTTEGELLNLAAQNSNNDLALSNSENQESQNVNLLNFNSSKLEQSFTNNLNLASQNNNMNQGQNGGSYQVQNEGSYQGQNQNGGSYQGQNGGSYQVQNGGSYQVQGQNGGSYQVQNGGSYQGQNEGQVQLQRGSQTISGQQVYQSEPVVTQRLISQPVITQRLISQPIIRRRIISQPIIKKRVIQRKLIQKTENVPATIENKTIRQNVRINIPANKIINNTRIQPQQHTITEKVNLVRQPSKTITHRPIMQKTEVKTQQSEKVVKAPAQQKHYYTSVLPINTIQRQSIRLQQQEPQYQNSPTKMLKPIIKETQRQKTYKIQGNEIHIQPIIKRVIQKENTKVELVREPTQYKNRQAIVNNPQVQNSIVNRVVQQPGQVNITQPIVQNYVRNNNVNYVQKPLLRRVVRTRTVAVPTPVLKHEEVVKRIPYTVVMPKAKPITNNTHVHVSFKNSKRRRRPVLVSSPQQDVRYRRNYQRDLTNNGFGGDSVNYDRANLSGYHSYKDALAGYGTSNGQIHQAQRSQQGGCCVNGAGSCCKRNY